MKHCSTSVGIEFVFIYILEPWITFPTIFGVFNETPFHGPESEAIFFNSVLISGSLVHMKHRCPSEMPFSRACAWSLHDIDV